MTIHEPHSPTPGFRCTTPGCHTVRAGYASASAAIRAETHHTEQAHPARTAVTR